jgi:hypothetical protein
MATDILEPNVVYNPELWKDREQIQMELKEADALIVRKLNAEFLNFEHQLKVIIQSH